LKNYPVFIGALPGRRIVEFKLLYAVAFNNFADSVKAFII